MTQIIWTEEKADKVIRMLTEYFEQYGFGECIAQGDEAQFRAVELMCEIVDDILVYGEGYISN